MPWYDNPLFRRLIIKEQNIRSFACSAHQEDDVRITPTNIAELQTLAQDTMPTKMRAYAALALLHIAGHDKRKFYAGIAVVDLVNTALHDLFTTSSAFSDTPDIEAQKSAMQALIKQHIPFPAYAEVQQTLLRIIAARAAINVEVIKLAEIALNKINQQLASELAGAPASARVVAAVPPTTPAPPALLSASRAPSQEDHGTTTAHAAGSVISSTGAAQNTATALSPLQKRLLERGRHIVKTPLPVVTAASFLAVQSDTPGRTTQTWEPFCPPLSNKGLIIGK